MSDLKNKVILVSHWILFLSSTTMLKYILTVDPERHIFDDLCQLTNMNETFICLLYLTMVVYDMKILLLKSHPPNRYRYSVFVYIAYQVLFSLSGLVTISYWALRMYDYRLIASPGETQPPIIFSCFSHGINWLLLFIEGLILPQRNHKSAVWKLLLYVMVIVSYVCVQFTFWRFTGKYVYPFLEVFTTTMTVNFYLALFGLCYLIDRSGFWLNHIRWNQNKQERFLIDDTPSNKAH